MKYDVFISHASEDKTEVASPLAYHLVKNGLRVWIDDFELTLGDSLRRSIDRGLTESRFGIIILSPKFFKKEWPKRELDGLFARDDGTEKVILPIWHKITKDDVIKVAPTLADKLAVSTENGIEYVTQKVLQAVHRHAQHNISTQENWNVEHRRDEELSHIRKDILLSHSIRDLQEASYKIDEVLSRYPTFYQARLLKDEIRAAINRERMRHAPPTSSQESWTGRLSKPARRLYRVRWLFGFIVIASVSYLLYLLNRWIWEILK
ncbi:toll/interleukin-1 receptor domain-containing protein [bacterium]|nr:toll/interleukin-1 receptor domain-containing protein [bacterium]